MTFYSYTLGFIAFFSSVIGTLIGKLGGAEEQSVNQGLFGYNSILTGMALFLFLSGHDRWWIALAGAAFAVIPTAALTYIMRPTKIPVLTLPFIVLTWFGLLASYHLSSFKISPALAPQSLSQWTLEIKGETNWLNGMIDGIGQVFFIDHMLSGILVIIALFWAGWKFGVYALIGSFSAMITSSFLGGENHLIFSGMYGYNAVLAIISVSIVFKENDRNGLLLGIIAACLTVPATASVMTLLMPYGLPVLTIPFVLITWIFLAARKVLPSL